MATFCGYASLFVPPVVSFDEPPMGTIQPYTAAAAAG